MFPAGAVHGWRGRRDVAYADLAPLLLGIETPRRRPAISQSVRSALHLAGRAFMLLYING